jgi:hypothetical protein
MEKEFIIKIYKKKAGAHSETFVREVWSGYCKKTAFKEGRGELVRIANCDLARGPSESSENDILEEIKSIEKGSDNYYHDQTTWSFKVFSKSIKK